MKNFESDFANYELVDFISRGIQKEVNKVMYASKLKVGANASNEFSMEDFDKANDMKIKHIITKISLKDEAGSVFVGDSITEEIINSIPSTDYDKILEMYSEKANFPKE